MRPESWRIRLALVLKTSQAAQRSEICVPVASYGRPYRTYNKIKSLCDIRETLLRRTVETRVLENTSCVGVYDVSGGPAF